MVTFKKFTFVLNSLPMATKLTKDISREFLLKPDWMARGTYIITLQPNGMISFREKGRKTKHSAYLLHVLDLAIKTGMQQEYITRLKDYNLKKNAGYKRLRKPRKPKFI